MYKALDQPTRTGARKAFRLWFQNPFHPSLHFKCINNEEKIWAVRVTIVYRAIGIFDGDTVTWFWIGHHDEYERFFL
ncbi:MAG: ParE family toxin-like protein [Candidatus Anammoxibacter sp.]